MLTVDTNVREMHVLQAGHKLRLTSTAVVCVVPSFVMLGGVFELRTRKTCVEAPSALSHGSTTTAH